MLEAQSGPGTKRPPQWAGVGKLWEAFQALSQSASQTYCTPPLRSLPDTWSRCERYGSSGDIGYRSPVRVFATPAQHRLEREVGAQAEKAYRRFVKDFKATVKKGAGAATGARISSARKGQAARQGQPPNPAL